MAGRAVFVIGVSGCGKSSVGQALAEAMGATYLEGDAFHPAENVAAMASGRPLTDQMRWPWLQAIAKATAAEVGAGRDVVVACSALRRVYRDILRQGAAARQMILLNAERNLIHDRMAARSDHYMPASLLDSQIATLEMPEPGETDVVILDNSGPLSAVIAAAEKLVKTGF